jgi:hypothetical protein
VPGSRWNSLLAILPGKPLMLLAAVLMYVGILGTASVDIGHHWDEPLILKSVQSSVRCGSILPGWYLYPSACYDIAMLTAAAHLATGADRASPAGGGTNSTRQELVDYLGSNAFKLQLRSVFFVLSSLTGLIVYCLARRLSGSCWIALFAALAVVSSWEFTYHAKWIATDCLLVLFASSSLLCQYGILSAERQRRRALMVIASAIFAGLAIGTKYPGGIVLAPLVLAIGLSAKQQGLKLSREILLCVMALLLAGVAFLVTTPGCFLEPEVFKRDVSYERAHYGQFGHGGYSVTPGWDHFSKILVYLAAILLSENAALAVTASVLAISGVVHLARKQPRIAVWFGALPLLYIAYMSLQKVMMVRNYLLLLPFLAVFAALGLGAAASVTSRFHIRSIVCGAAVFFILYNLGVATMASLSVLHPNTQLEGAAIAERISSSPRTRVYLSPACRELMTADFLEKHRNIAESPNTADRFVFLSTEVPSWRSWKANVPGRYRTIWARLWDVNWDYYPSWEGFHRVLDISASDPELEPLRKQVAR